MYERTRARRRPQVCTVATHHQSSALPRHERPGSASRLHRSVVIAKLLKAACAWWGFTTADDRNRIEVVVRRRARAGLYPVDGPAASGSAARVGL